VALPLLVKLLTVGVNCQATPLAGPVAFFKKKKKKWLDAGRQRTGDADLNATWSTFFENCAFACPI
jgi:hypothetical protein